MATDQGRRRKYGREKLSERIVFYVTESQQKELDNLSEGDISGYVRQKVFEECVAERRKPPPELQAVSARVETLPNTFTFQVATLIYELFDKMSRRVGYDDPNNLAKDLITRAATNETKALGFLFSDVKAQSEEVAHERAAEMDDALGVKQIKKSAAK